MEQSGTNRGGAEGLKANSRVGAEELAVIGREGGRGRLGGISVRDQRRRRRLGPGQEQRGWETQGNTPLKFLVIIPRGHMQLTLRIRSVGGAPFYYLVLQYTPTWSDFSFGKSKKSLVWSSSEWTFCSRQSN